MYGYAKDNKYIYYMGQAVVGADVKSFFVFDKGRVLDHNAYAIDKYKVYFGGKAIEGVDLVTFEVFDSRITRDKFNIYWEDKKLKNIDMETFKYTGEDTPRNIGYGKPGGCIAFYMESMFKDKNGEYRTDDEDFVEKFVVK